MTFTDFITLIFCAFMIFQGLRRGFIGSVLGPLALILSSIVAFVYYICTKNIAVSLSIGLLGPMILAWIFRFMLRSWSKASNPEGKLSLASRLGGAALSLTWGLVMLVIFILLLAIVPPVNKPLQSLYKDIHQSIIYKIIKPLDTFAIDKSSPQESLETLSKDQRIQAILNDPKIVEAAQNKDYAALMNNPKIMALVQDPQMVKRMMAIYRQIQQPEGE